MSKSHVCCKGKRFITKYMAVKKPLKTKGNILKHQELSDFWITLYNRWRYRHSHQTHILKTEPYKKINLLWKGHTNDQESFINSSCTFEWTWLETDVTGSALNSSFARRLLKRETSFNLKKTHNNLQTTHKINYNCQCGLLGYECSNLIMGLLPWRRIVVKQLHLPTRPQ